MSVLSRKSIKCRDISSFYSNVATGKCNTAKIVTASVVKRQKHKPLPFNKIRSNLNTLKYIKPPLSYLNNKTVYMQSKNRHRANLYWFEERV